MRNGKKTAILAVMDEAAKKKPEKKKDSRLYYVYRPNTGQQVKQVGHIYINVFDVAIISTKVGLDVSCKESFRKYKVILETWWSLKKELKSCCH